MELTAKLDVEANAFSKTAEAAIKLLVDNVENSDSMRKANETFRIYGRLRI